MTPTAKFSRTFGTAEIELNKRGQANIGLKVRDLPSVLDIGGLYTSYVVWAVLADGSSDNIGELKTNPKKKDSDASLKPIVQETTFGLVITLEPHSKVTIPSNSIVLKSPAPTGPYLTITKSSLVKSKFNKKDYFREVPKLNKKQEKQRRRTPISYFAAQNAVKLAREAGAETSEIDSVALQKYSEAVVLLKELEAMNLRKTKDDEIDLLAYEIINLSSNAQKNATESRIRRKNKLVESRNRKNLERLREEIKNLKKNNKELQKDLATEKKEKENLQRDFDLKAEYSIKLEEEKKQLAKNNETLFKELRAEKRENENLQARLDKILYTKKFQDEIPILLAFLRNFGKAKQYENNLILTLPNEIWLVDENEKLNPEKLRELQELSKKIGENKFLKIEITSYVVPKEDLVDARMLADLRAKAIRDLFFQNGVNERRIKVDSIIQDRSKNQGGVKITFSLID